MSSTISAINRADQTFHSLAQLLAQTAMQKLPDQADDSQTNLEWNNDSSRLEGRPFSQDGQLIRLVIDTDQFALAFLSDDNQPVVSFLLNGKTPAQTQAWWQNQLHAWGTTDFRTLNYQLDGPPVDEQTSYTQPEGLSEWAHWRTVANKTLFAFNTLSSLVSEVRIWPHHFDTGVYYSFPDVTGSERAAIWAGYAVADTIRNEPYFYLSGYDRNEPINFGQATALSIGEWVNSTDWKGALLPISVVTDSRLIHSFFAESYQWLSEQIGISHSR